MRLLLSLLFLWGGVLICNAQEPVQWRYALEQKGPRTFEVKAIAKLEKGWHIYSLTTPDGGPVPTQFQFTKNPVLIFKGTVRESGEKIKKYEEVFDVNTEYYDHRVEFSQTIQLKAAAKTSISGTVTYMVCSDERCLPPTTKPFRLTIQ